MGAFPFFLLFGGARGGGGCDPIRRCRKCGEPITKLGSFIDRHPITTALTFVVCALGSAGLLLQFLSWSVDRDFNNPHTETFIAYLWFNLQGLWDLVRHLW